MIKKKFLALAFARVTLVLCFTFTSSAQTTLITTDMSTGPDGDDCPAQSSLTSTSPAPAQTLTPLGT